MPGIRKDRTLPAGDSAGTLACVESAGTFEQVVIRLSHDFPTVSRGTIQRIMLEEHDLLIGVQPGDIVPPVLVEATIERLERLAASAGGAAARGRDEAELA